MSDAALATETVEKPSGQQQGNDGQSGADQQQKPDGGTVLDNVQKPAAGDKPKFEDTWRQHLSGGDEKLLSELSRLKSPTDIAKEYVRQKQELSKPRAPLTLAKDATPEQIAEYRKAVGVPDAGTIEAYGIAAPEGYELSEVEKGALSDLTKSAHAANLPTGAVKTIADVFFRNQAANQQAMNKLDGERSKAWKADLQSEMGKDFEPMVGAAEAYLTQQFGDDAEGKAELLSARLPGGGKLGDHPFFVKIMVDAALKNGFADRIEGNEIETAGGKPLGEQQLEIERLQFSDRARYNLPATQARLDKIIAARVARGEIDEMGNETRRRA